MSGNGDTTILQSAREELVSEMLRNIVQHREEILTAFVAKYGIEDPAQIEQVTTTDPRTGHTV